MTSKQSVAETLYPLLIAVAIGVLAGLGAVALRMLINFEIDLLWPDGDSFVKRYTNAHWAWRLTAPMLAGLIISPLIFRAAPEVRVPGVSEVIKALSLQDGIIKLPIKSLVWM
jgi:chloride channel protein, CIC family